MRVKVGILATALLLCGCGDMNSKPVTALVLAERNDELIQGRFIPMLVDSRERIAALEAKVRSLELGQRDLIRLERDN